MSHVFLSTSHRLVEFGGLPSALTLGARSGEAVLSEKALGFAFAGAWNRESIPLVIERVGAKKKKQLEG